MELPINDAELATIVGALRLGGDTSLYQKLKIAGLRDDNLLKACILEARPV